MLAHSLRDGGTTKKLGALVTLDTVAVEVVTQLQASLSRPGLFADGASLTVVTRRPCTTT